MRRRVLVFLLAVMTTVGLWPGAAPAATKPVAPPADSSKAAEVVPEWQWRNPLPQGHEFKAVAFGNGRWVAVGPGALVTSPDGVTWTVAPDSGSRLFDTIAFGKGQFVASAFGEIATSTDGIAWTRRHTYVGQALTDIVYGNDRWVGVNGSGAVFVSTDGVAWKAYVANIPEGGPKAVAYGDGRFVAVGPNGLLMVSTDGIRWNPVELAETADLQAVAYGNGRFVVGGSTNLILTAKDGLAWEKGRVPIPESTDGDWMKRIVFDGRRFLAVRGTVWGTALAASDDGVVWEQVTPHQMPTINSVAAGDGQLIAVGAGGMILSSPDGKAWTPRTGGTFANLSAVAAGNGMLVAVGWTEGAGVIYTSPDGVTWTPRHSGEGQFKDIVFGEGHFVALSGSAFHRSVDGIHWETTAIGNGFAPMHLAYANGTFVAVGVFGTALASEDGEVWTVGSMPAKEWLHDVTFGNGIFVAVGDQGTILTSPDGLTWTKQETGVPAKLTAVAYGQDGFMATGMGALLLGTADGKSWTKQTGSGGNTPGEVSALIYTEAGFVASSWSTGIYRWEKETGWRPWAERQVRVVIEDFVLAAGQVVAVGTQGVILTSGGPPASPSFTETRIRPDPARSQVTADRTFLPPDDRSIATVTVTLLGPNGQPVAGELVGIRRHATNAGIAPSSALTNERGQATFRLKNRVPQTVRYWVEVPGQNLVLTQGLTITFATCSGRFADVAVTEPRCQPIEEMASRKVIGGFPDGLFRPDGSLTRAELAKMLTMYLGKQPEPEGALPHTDVAGHWAYQAGWLQAAEANGAMTGYPDGSFQPDRPVTRAELIKAIMVAGQLPTGGYMSYGDVPGEAWYSGWVGGAQRAGVIGTTARWPVFTEGRLLPEQPATRAEAAVVLANLWDRLHP